MIFRTVHPIPTSPFIQLNDFCICMYTYTCTYMLCAYIHVYTVYMYVNILCIYMYIYMYVSISPCTRNSHMLQCTAVAVYFEQAEWEQCLETCKLAVERGREHRADFKIIAKSVSHTHTMCTHTNTTHTYVRIYVHTHTYKSINLFVECTVQQMVEVRSHPSLQEDVCVNPQASLGARPFFMSQLVPHQRRLDMIT